MMNKQFNNIAFSKLYDIYISECLSTTLKHSPNKTINPITNNIVIINFTFVLTDVSLDKNFIILPHESKFEKYPHLT